MRVIGSMVIRFDIAFASIRNAVRKNRETADDEDEQRDGQSDVADAHEQFFGGREVIDERP